LIRIVSPDYKASSTPKRATICAFFPSYEYMTMVVDRFEKPQVNDVQILVQEREMDDADRAAFLTAFQSQNNQTLVGFAVMGGFSARESTWWASGSVVPSLWVWVCRPSARKET
jgi:hypothetical protein